MKVHSKIKKQSLSSKQERELLFSVCVGPEEVLFQLLVLELALLPLWDPLPVSCGLFCIHEISLIQNIVRGNMTSLQW